MNNPPSVIGLCHVALFVSNLEPCEDFYVNIIGMQVQWRPDKDNVYLSSGSDNLALHRLPKDQVPHGIQRLDHIGFIVSTHALIDHWYEYLKSYKVTMKTEPHTHRDGARSFYCIDPSGTTVQFIALNHKKP
ncbi:VOC family protein [Candidatus Nitrosacidococcus sp. I8]|uniref:VOC family protein n=1 Tax=Candidatus Nitrosacidococcus sp. I8 TaxID=2942908 RepID=UPI002227007D|nr:VOC family protein [Candidatus Nitrosacidococcus sp. I8]CAH9018963.1 hypothetical protein NURINAE_01246 [Candidatus Nitrosacidococcus sp. I8]